MRVNPLFDRIILESGEELYGIMDYVSKKHVYFFDFSQTSNPDLTLVVMLWRCLNDANKRFSVYATVNFPQIELPQANLIHRNHISDSTCSLDVTPKEKQQKRSIKYRKTQS